MSWLVCNGKYGGALCFLTIAANMIGTSVSRHHQNFTSRSELLSTDEARIIPLLLITTAGSMWIAGTGRSAVAAGNLSGGTLAAAAQTLNCIYDRDIDYEMEHTDLAVWTGAAA